MPEETFDIASLAPYLHMMPAQVARLAERGKLPGRRVAGQWRFNQAEINQWLEQRIGLSDDDELAVMETNLRRDEGAAARAIDFAELLLPEAIAVPLAARTRSSAIRVMCQLAAATGMLWDVEKMTEAVTQREAMSPTALEHGVALLHPRRPQPSILGQAVLALGVTGSGIPFGGGRLTDVFFLICATSDHEYLRILARLSRMAHDQPWVELLRTAADAAAARQLVLDRDAAFP
ncbi:MAG: PTS sugar transporter subunit IIA [Pirellulales bacterium]|nr:PTS sugar transporter subunit IIA [Pirellulales bacterium]